MRGFQSVVVGRFLVVMAGGMDWTGVAQVLSNLNSAMTFG